MPSSKNNGTGKQPYSYLPEIDGLRALAVISVMVFHLREEWLPGGFAGVDVFFVISGYVVSRAMAARSELSTGRYLVDFFSRRFVRILPALLVCLIVVSFLSVLFIPQSWLSTTIDKVGVWAFFGASNIALLLFNDGYFSPRAEYNPFTHTWSLGVEEQFYLVLPLLMLLWVRCRAGSGIARGSAVWGIPFLALLSFALAYWIGRDHGPAAYYLLPARFWELAAGVMLFQWQSSLRRYPQWSGTLTSQAVLGSGLFLILVGLLWADGEHFPYPWALLPVCGTVLCLHAISACGADKSLLRRLLRFAPVTYLGRISYSLYLWHWPVYTLFRWTVGLDQGWMVVAIVFTLTLASLSYHWVEQPVRKGLWIKQQRPLTKVVAAISIALVTAWGASALFENREGLTLSVTRDTAVWYPYAYQVTGEDNAELAGPLEGRKIYVVGNSHTPAYSGMLREVSVRLGAEVKAFPMGRCDLGNLLLNVGDYPGCDEKVEAMVNKLESELAAGDLVFFASLRTHRLIDQWMVFDYASVRLQSLEPYTENHPLLILDQVIGEVHSVPEAARGRSTDDEILGFDDVLAYSRSPHSHSRRQLALEETSKVIANLDKRGIAVLIDAPKPVFQIPPYRCSDWFNRMNPMCALGPRVSREQLLMLRQPVMESLNALESQFDNVFLWDPFPVLCPPAETCSVYDQNGKPLFFDGDHLSGHGNRRLYRDFAETLLKIFDKHLSSQSTASSMAKQ